MRQIRYCEFIYAELDNRFVGWHDWGWIDGEFEEPESSDPKASFQYIGITDKSGIHAIEGNIVTAGDNYPSVIEWDEESCKFFLHEYYPRHGRYADKYDRSHDIDAYTDGIGEIIGHINFNADLLRKLRR